MIRMSRACRMLSYFCAAASSGALLSPSSGSAGQIAVPPSLSWTGLYVGGHFGYGFSDSSWLHQSINPFSTTQADVPITLRKESFSANDPIAGGQVGVNYQHGEWVAGTEVSFTGTGLNDTRPISSGVFNQP